MRINPLLVSNSWLRHLLRASVALGACLSPLAAQKPAIPVELAHAAAARGHLSAGPAYTSIDGKEAPQFPEVDLAFSLRAADGSPVPGLYAAGNAAAFWTADGYPGPGATLAVGMTMGYRAGRHAAVAVGPGASPGPSRRG